VNKAEEMTGKGLPTLVYLEWSDSSSRSGWEDEEEMREFASSSSYLVRQVGWIYEEDDTKLVLYGRYHDWEVGEAKGRREYGNCQYIPKSWITSRKELS